MTILTSLPAHAAWYSPSWPYRIKLTIDADKVNGDQANFPVFVNLNDLNGTDFFSNVQSGEEIRVTKSDGTTEVAREFVYLDKTTNAGELHFVANGTLSGTVNSDWYMYYGNPNAQDLAPNNQYGSQKVWDSNYVGVWHMNENPVQDGSRQFTSANSEYFSVADNASLSTGDIDFTIAAWAYFDTLSANMGLISKWLSGSGNAEYVLTYQNGTSRLSFSVSNDGTASVSVNSDNLGAPAVANWYFIVAWHDANANTINIQVNDGTVDSAAHSTGVFDSNESFHMGRQNTNGNYNDGRISKVGFWKRTLTAAEKTYLYNQGEGRLYKDIGQSSTNGSNLKTNLISYWNLNEASGNAIDSHGSNNLTDNNTVTAASGPSTNNVVDSFGSNHGNLIGYTSAEEIAAWKSDTPLANGYSLEFDGTDDYFSVSSFTLTTKKTVSFWMKTTGGGLYGALGGASIHYYPLFDASFAYIRAGGGGFSTAHGGIDDGNWHHIAIAGNGNDARYYKDGVFSSSFGGDLAPAITTIAKADYFASDKFLNGSLDDVYVYNKTLSDNEIRYLYNGSGTNPGTSNLTALWKFDDGPAFIKDSTSNRNDGLSNGDMTSSDLVAGQAGKALDFDGTDDYIDFDDVLDAGTNDWTLTSWANIDADITGGDEWAVIAKRDWSGGEGYSVGINTSEQLRVLFHDGSNNVSKVGNGSLSISDWTNFSVVFDRDSNLSIYIDSSFDSATDMSTASGNEDNSLDLRFGHRFNVASFLDGKIDEVRISNIARSVSWTNTAYNNQNSSSTFYGISVESGPLITSFSPTDNGRNITIDANLVIGFDRTVDIQTGNLYIRKGSDDSLVETIAVNSAAVTGNGTATITINPTSNFPKATDLYVNIDGSTFNDSNGNPFFGITNNGTWNFTTTGYWYNGQWRKRIPITVKASQINGDLSNFPVYVNLGDLPAAFFDDASANGVDLRVTKSDGFTEVAREVVFLDKTANAGEMHFVANGTLSSSTDTLFYLYYDNASAKEPAGSAANVWLNNYVAVYHMQESPVNGSAMLIDSTSNSSAGTPDGGMNGADLVNGQIGKAIVLDGVNDNIKLANEDLFDFTGDFTLSLWLNPTTMWPGSGKCPISKFGNSSYQYCWVSSNSGYIYVNNGYAVRTKAVVDSLNASQWMMHTVVFRSNTTNSEIYLDNQARGTDHAARTNTSNSQQFTIGSRADSGAVPVDAIVDELRVSSTARSANWVTTQYNNHNAPSSFYDNGSVESSPIGSATYGDAWNKRVAIKINASEVNGDLSNFPIYVNLAHLNGEPFFSNVDANGADIRMTKSDGVTEVAREIVSIDTTNNAGEMYFVANGSLSGSSNTTFYLYYDNPVALEPAANSTYGSQNVWANNYVGVWHMQEDPNGDVANAIKDSTSNLNHGNPNGSMTTADLVNGTFGKAIDFEGTDDYIAANLSTLNAPFTLMSYTYFDALTQPGADYDYSIAVGSTVANSYASISRFAATNIFYTYDGASARQTSTAITGQVWHHMVLTTATSNPYISGYLNSVALSYTSQPGAAINTNGNLKLARYEPNDHHLDGRIDEARASSVARSQDWIKTQYNNLNSPSTFYTIGGSGGLFDWQIF